MASEKRRHKRIAKRLKSRFGEGELDHSAITSDISASGVFVQSTHLPKIGVRLHMELTSREGVRVFVETVVTRHVLVPSELRAIMKSGFGVRFVTGPELLAELIPDLKNNSGVSVTYDTPAAFRSAWDNELQRGGVHVWSPNEYPLNSVVTLELVLPFCSQRFELEVRVVNVVNAPGGKRGVTLVFIDGAGALAALRPMLTP